MREITYITGIPCSGKSTTAQRASEGMKLQQITLDQMCLSAAKEIGCPDPRKLSLPSFWENVPNARDVKKRALEKLFAREGCDGDLIVEGSALMYRDIRSIIDEIIGEHSRVFLLIDVSYEDWLGLWESRYIQGLDPRTKPPSVDAYKAYLDARCLFQPPKHYWTVSHPQEIRAFGHRPYQKGGWRDDFTDGKWEGLHLPSLSDKALLDLACNAGGMCQRALSAGATRVIGADYNLCYLREAHHAGVETMFLDLAHLDRVKEKFDYVLLLSAHHYIRDPERLIEQIAGLTKELFVWEGPVSLKDGLVLEFRDGTPYNNYIPTEGLLQLWLERSFARVERIGPSVSPDTSTRVVYHCWKGGL